MLKKNKKKTEITPTLGKDIYVPTKIKKEKRSLTAFARSRREGSRQRKQQRKDYRQRARQCKIVGTVAIFGFLFWLLTLGVETNINPVFELTGRVSYSTKTDSFVLKYDIEKAPKVFIANDSVEISNTGSRCNATSSFCFHFPVIEVKGDYAYGTVDNVKLPYSLPKDTFNLLYVNEGTPYISKLYFEGQIVMGEFKIRCIHA